MMGQLPRAQNALFYELSLEQHIPNNHLLRQIDQFLDFDSIRRYLTPYYSHTGRPSIDPELMIPMLLVGYCYGIRSERQLSDFGVESFHVHGRLLGMIAAVKHIGRPLQQLGFPLGNLIGMDIEPLCQFGHCLLALEGCQCHFGFEGR